MTIDFKEIITNSLSKFDWEIPHAVKQYTENNICIEFPQCTILFFHNYHYGTVECEFSNPVINSPTNYHLLKVLKFNSVNSFYDKDLFNNVPSQGKVESYTERLLNVIYDKLQHVIKGDFTWSEKADEFNRNVNEIQKTLGTIFIFDHPIYKKLDNNDSSWQEDLLAIEKK